MRIRKKSLPRCRYGGRKNRRIGRHLRQKPKKEYDNGNNDHREQRLPPARGEDREDNRLRGGIPEPGGNGAQTERGSGKPCCQGTESRPEVDDAQGGVRDAGHQPPVTRNFAASLFRNIKYFTLRKLYLCRKWMQKRLQKTTTTGITLPNFDFLA